MSQSEHADLKRKTCCVGAGGAEEGCAGVGCCWHADRCPERFLQELPEATKYCIAGHCWDLGVSFSQRCGSPKMSWKSLEQSHRIRPLNPPCSHFCRSIEKEKRRAEQQAKEVKAKAKAMAIALSTIGKFVIKKKVGEDDRIFGR